MKIHTADSYARILKIQDQLHYRFKARGKIKEIKGWSRHIINTIKNAFLGVWSFFVLSHYTKKVYYSITYSIYTIKLIRLEVRSYIFAKRAHKYEKLMKSSLIKGLQVQEKIVSLKEQIN